MLKLAAMGNQRRKLLRIVVGKALDGGLVEQCPTEAPTQFQLTAVNLAIQGQQAA
ncbi:hypothetical protein D3C80_1730780 [compost metagenome]